MDSVSLQLFTHYKWSKVSYFLWCYRLVKVILWTLSIILGRDSSVGIATRYELHGPEIESRWG